MGHAYPSSFNLELHLNKTCIYNRLTVPNHKSVSGCDTITMNLGKVNLEVVVPEELDLTYDVDDQHDHVVAFPYYADSSLQKYRKH
jgi:hypothetical protein